MAADVAGVHPFQIDAEAQVSVAVDFETLDERGLRELKLAQDVAFRALPEFAAAGHGQRPPLRKMHSRYILE